MTNALTQKIDTTITSDTTLDLLASNVSTQTAQLSSSTFSNLINNLETKTSQMQTNFEGQVQKTNTSSINKKALETSKNSTDTADTTSVSKKTVQNDSKASKKQNSTSQKTTQNKKTGKNTVSTKTSQKTNIVKEDEKYTAETENTAIIADNNNNNEITEDESSFINFPIPEDTYLINSSPVGSSPVFSLDNKDETVQISENSDDTVIDKALFAIDTSFVQKPDNIDTLNKTADKTSDKISLLDTKENISDFVEEISQTSDSFDLFSENENEFQKEPLVDEDIIKDNQDIIKKEDMVDLSDETVYRDDEKINHNIYNEKSQTSSIQRETNDDEITVLSYDDKKTTLDEDINFNDDNLKIKDEPLRKADNKKLEAFQSNIEIKDTDIKSDELNIALDKTDIDTVDTTENVKLPDDNKIKKEDIKPLKNDDAHLIDKYPLKEKKTVIEADFSKFSKFAKNENTISFDNQQNDLIKDIQNIDFKNNDDIEKIVNLLDKVEENDNLELDFGADFKKQIDNLKVEVEKTLKTDEIDLKDNKKIEEAISNLREIVKPKADNYNDDEEINTSINNTVDLSMDFEKIANNNKKENFYNYNEKNQNQDYTRENTSELDFETIKESDFKVDFDKKPINTKNNENTIDLKATEENLQKVAFTNEILEEMMVQIEPSIISQSGALSVADEVAKLAMTQENGASSLSPVSSIHGNITYDANNASSVIKNAAIMMKNAANSQNTTSMSDIFNQITNKITQLQDGQGQKLTMVLRPNDLGRLSIELTNNNSGLTANIMAQNDDVRSYIEKNINSLKQNLTDAGVNVNNIQIKTMGQEGSSNYEGNNQQKGYNEGNFQEGNSKNQQDNQQHGNHTREEKESYKELLSSISNYDTHFSRDFSSVLSKTMSYNLN